MWGDYDLTIYNGLLFSKEYFSFLFLSQIFFVSNLIPGAAAGTTLGFKCSPAAAQPGLATPEPGQVCLPLPLLEEGVGGSSEPVEQQKDSFRPSWVWVHNVEHNLLRCCFI